MATYLVRERPRRALAVALLVVALVAGLLIARAADSARATSGGSPYAVPTVTDTNADPNIVETTIVADEATVDIGGGVDADVYAFNGTVPGPEFRLNVGQRVIVHFENHLDAEETGIHWHGIELSNPNDGTPLTQNQVEPGDTFLYDFVVTRPGVYWYHPHHEFSTNQVFKGLYGSIIVSDAADAALVADGTLPGPADTHTLNLSDITVCKTPGTNDTATYNPALPWVGGGPLPVQAAPTPTTLCDTPMDNHGDALGGALAAGDVPNIQRKTMRVNEGQTVLTNGVNVGGRAGTPSAPGALDAGASVLDVQPGQGVRFQIVNEATTRFFRLRATDNAGAQLPLVRVGGEGGLLDAAVLDGTTAGGFDFDYDAGEILLDPGDRTDVVVAIPASASGVATIWTQDYRRTGNGDVAGGWTRTPTVPVAHLNVTGAAVSPAYTIGAGTALRSSPGLDPVEQLPAPTGTLLDPATFPVPEAGSADQDIRLTTTGGFPGIDGVKGHHDFTADYTLEPHHDSSRWALIGDTLQLSVTNATPADHPFHLHGFSIQPLSYSDCNDGTNPLPIPGVTFAPEFVDNFNVPGNCTLNYRIRLDDRPFPDGTPGGGVGRWVFHCHIFFHHHQGMTSELVVVAPSVDITSPPDGALYPVGSNVPVTADVFGGVTPSFDWDDGSTDTPGTPTDADSYSASHVFGAAGVYTITATVEAGGITDTDTTMIVVYDPSAGFVTGGGRIDSPPGAYVADPSLTGPATFGFVSKYKKGATAPTGQTEFTFHVADFAFHSETYQWLVVAGAKAQYKGTGTVNGVGSYGFLLTATDGALNGGGGFDRFRIKIWDIDAASAIVYDNVLGASDDIDTANPTVITSGSIVVHKK
ncbi:MAG TPA: multicopper oxidase domain-containing protein [Acidimicrobiia bacterium]|nr:multicopper oxidase domain-containing protein [Acidimicrobiia bacterium]